MALLKAFTVHPAAERVTTQANIFPGELTRIRSVYNLPGNLHATVQTLPTFKTNSSTQKIAQPWIDKIDSFFGRSYSDDFYHRIRIIPVAIDFGSVGVGEARTFNLWSAFFHPVTITAQQVNTTGSIDLSINPVPSTPEGLEALEYLTYEVSTLNAGPPAFEDSITWTIDGVDYALPVTGVRLQVWAFDHNWATPAIESFSAKTDIIVSHNGDEQRRSHRDDQRLTYRYEYLITDDDVDFFQSRLFTWQMYRWAVPVESDRRMLGVALSAGSAVIPFNPDNYGYTPGENLLLQTDRETFELGQVLSIQPGISITLVSVLKQSWPETADIMPTKPAKMPNAVRFQEVSSNAYTARMSWLCIPGDTDPVLPAGAFTLYLGSPVIDREPNFRGVPHTWTVDRLSSDTGLGPVRDIVRADYPFMDREFRWLYEGREEITRARELIGYLNGRQKSVWVPSWRADFDPADDIDAGENSVRVRNKGEAEFFTNHPARTHIFILLKDGTFFCREWLSITDLMDGTIRLVIDSSLGQNVALEDISLICYLLRRRSMSDDVSLTWHSSTVVEDKYVYRAVKA
jgi:hypothetical protein